MVTLTPFTSAMISFIRNWSNIRLYYESKTTKTSYLHVEKTTHTQRQYVTERKNSRQQQQNRGKLF